MIGNLGKSIRIAAVVFSHYPADPRPRREAEALVEAGMSVDVLCLKKEGELREEVVNGVQVLRLPAIQTRSGKLQYLWEYGWFILLAFVKVSMLHLKKRYHVIHIHNMPDALVFCALLPRLSGAKILLDLHDPMPEIYMTKYSVNASHPAIWLLRLLEKWSIRFANLVVTPNVAFQNLFISRGCPRQKIHIVMNSPQESIFGKNPSRPCDYGNGSEFVVMYHGAIMERNGLDTALRAVLRIKEEIPSLRFDVYGEGDSVPEFLNLVKKLRLDETVRFYGYRPLEAIAEAIQGIHVGVIPNKMNPFTNLNLPTRIFEYLSMEKPVIAPRTRGILDYFGEDSLFFFSPGDPESLAERIVEVYRNPARCHEILDRGVRTYQSYRWEGQRKYFVQTVKKLVGIEGSPA